MPETMTRRRLRRRRPSPGGFVGPGGRPLEGPDRGYGMPTPPGGNPPGPGGGTGGGPGPGPRNFGLPLDAQYEAQRRALTDAFHRDITSLRTLRPEILAQKELAFTRLGTNQDVDQDRLIDQMAARGIYGSGIQNRDTGRLETDYLRQRQDLSTGFGQQLSALAQQRGELRNSFTGSMQELLLDLARRQGVNPYAPRFGGGGGRRRRRGGPGGGGPGPGPGGGGGGGGDIKGPRPGLDIGRSVGPLEGPRLRRRR